MNSATLSDARKRMETMEPARAHVRRMQWEMGCVVCLQSFVSTRRDAKTCSSACRSYLNYHWQEFTSWRGSDPFDEVHRNVRRLTVTGRSYEVCDAD